MRSSRWMLFAERFSTYFQDKLPWLGSLFRSLSASESEKKQQPVDHWPTPRGILVDLLTICLISALLMLLASLLNYLREQDEPQPISRDPAINDSVESAGSSVCSMPLLGSTESKTNRRDCGDSVHVPRVTLSSAPMHLFTDRRANTSSFAQRRALRPTGHNDCNKLGARAIARRQYNHQPRQGRNEQLNCLVRRTRSGRIYGKYTT